MILCKNCDFGKHHRFLVCTLTLRKAGEETGGFGKCNSTVGNSTVCFQYDCVLV